MKNLTRKQAEAIYAMWEARAERLGRVRNSKGVHYQRRAMRLRSKMLQRIDALDALLYPPTKRGFIEGWEIMD